MSTQSYEKHNKFVPMYHFVAFGILAINFLWTIYFAFKNFSAAAVIASATAFALLSLFLYARLFPLGVQDRLIRLEERIRLQELLPADMKPRATEFTTEQLIALRFASDTELPELAAKVLDEGIADRGAVKKLIKEWRPDLERI